MTSVSESATPVKVSIVLPTYNQCHFLPDAVKTILNQTYSNFELIIVNDGSTDATSMLLTNLQNPQIRVLNQQNQGLPNALNAGFALARGEYWTWTSTDNVVGPTWLEELVKALDQSPQDVGYAFSHYAGMDEQGKILFVNQDQRFDVPTLLMRHTGNASFLYRASLARQVGPYDSELVYAEDLDMWVRMASVTRAQHVPTVLYYYRLHANSMTTQSEKVRKATEGVVTKYLAQTQGQFDIDSLFPSIALSANPALERWKSRILLVSNAMNATYYAPVDALVAQLQQALKEQYETGLVANIVHLLAKSQRWSDALAIVQHYEQTDNAPLLMQLVTIAQNKDHAALQQVPFLTLDEKLCAADCTSPYTQTQLLRNYANAEHPIFSLEKIVIELAEKLEDQADHPEVWLTIASLQSDADQIVLQQVREFVTELTRIPQEPKTSLLLQVLEAMCKAYTQQETIALNQLQQLQKQHPSLPLIEGAIRFIQQDARLSSPAFV